MTWTPRTKAAAGTFESLLASGRIGEAEEYARRLLADPQWGGGGGAAVAMARCAVVRQDPAAALRWADRAVRIAPEDEGAVTLHAALLLASGQASRAVASLDRALARLPHPHRPDTTLTLVHALLNMAEFERAEETLTPLLRMTRAHAELTGRLAGALAGKTGRAGWVLYDAGTGWVRGALHRDLAADLPITVRVNGNQLLSLPLALFLEHHGTMPTAQKGESAFHLKLERPVPAGGISPTEVAVWAGGRLLLGAPISLEPAAEEVEGVVDAQGNILIGWSRHPHRPEDTVEIVVRDAAGAEARTSTVPNDIPLGSPDVPHSFRLDLAITGLVPGRLWVEAGRDRRPLAGSPVRWIDWPVLVRARATYTGDRTPAMAAAVAEVLPWVPLPVGGRPERPPSPVVPRDCFDIIVPVYRGHEETMACLRAVAETTRGAPCEVIVINDASPEPALAAELRTFVSAAGMTLLENGGNLGFPGTVNRGLALHPDRDVLILNADTIVAGDWWRRLRAAAYSGADVGTVTPLSNDATILSYPSQGETSGGEAPAMPTAEETGVLDRHAAMANADRTVEIPTGVGFCLYIRRDCLDEIGLLNDEAFAQGYGEENDFCLRARQVGWRHLAATNVFVAHVGGRSFAHRKTVLLARNLAILNRLHPGYDALVGRFIADDPLAPARRRMDLARWRPAERPAALLVTLDLGGGVARHVTERAVALAEEGASVLVLRPHPPRADGALRCRVEDRQCAELRDLVFVTAEETDELVALLRRAGVAWIEIHHTLNHDAAILSLPRRLGVPYDMVLHDYGWLCPRITLIDGSGRYCREPGIDVCDRCVAVHGSRYGADIAVAGFRQSSATVLLQSRSAIVPSDDAAGRLKRYLPMMSARVTPWDRVPPPPAAARPFRRAGNRLRVCIVGAIGRHKGYDIILECARDAAHRDLPLDFTIVGYTENDGPLLATGRVFITGPFDEGEATGLIMAQQADVGWLPSVWPETWCYTLSECWQAGLAVVAFDLGAIAERIRRQGGGFLLPLDVSPPSINDALLALVTNGEPSLLRSPSSFSSPPPLSTRV